MSSGVVAGDNGLGLSFPQEVDCGSGSMLQTARQEPLVGLQKGAPHSLCGKSSARKSFRQKWAPRRATPVGLSRLPSMSSLSSEGSFLSSYEENTQDLSPVPGYHVLQ